MFERTDLLNLRPPLNLSGSTLKWVAIITMLIDHVAWVLLATALSQGRVPYDTFFFVYEGMRSVGRLAFPLFSFLLVEGFLHTRNAQKYALRLLAFAFLSEVPFDLAAQGSWFYPDYQNVFWTLLLGLLAMMGIDWCSRHVPSRSFFSAAASVGWVAVMAFAAFLAHTDYYAFGVIYIAGLYALRFSRGRQCIFGAVAVAWEITAPLSALFMWCYNGKRGMGLKWLFYWFYPLHLLVLGGLRVFIFGG